MQTIHYSGSLLTPRALSWVAQEIDMTEHQLEACAVSGGFSLKSPLASGNTLRNMQAPSAAAAYEILERIG